MDSFKKINHEHIFYNKNCLVMNSYAEIFTKSCPYACKSGRTINGVGEEIHQYLFSVQKNRKQVNFPVKLKSTKTKFRREITCLTLMILNYYLIYKTKILY